MHIFITNSNVIFQYFQCHFNSSSAINKIFFYYFAALIVFQLKCFPDSTGRFCWKKLLFTSKCRIETTHNKGHDAMCEKKLRANKRTVSFINLKAVVQRSSLKKVFLEILQNLQGSICARVSFLKKRLWHRCFLVNFVKFLRKPYCIKDLRWLLL